MAKLLLNNQSITEKIDLQGYTRITENGILMDYSAASIRFCVKAKGEVEIDFHLTTGEMPSFAVYVDNKLVYDFLKPTEQKRKDFYTLSFSVGEEEKLRVVEIVRKSDCIVGSCEALSILVDGEFLNIEKPTKVIDFLGDSITSAGSCFKMGDEFLTSANNSYAFITAKKLGWGYTLRSRSGSGFMMSYSGNRGIGFSWDETYKIDCFVRSETAPYVPTKKADVICIFLGTNDLEQNWSKTEAERDSLFVPKMEELLNLVRQYNSTAPVVWIAGGMTKAYLPQLKKAVTNLGGEKADIYLCEITSGLNAGGSGHPNCAQQEQIANELISFLKNNKITG